MNAKWNYPSTSVPHAVPVLAPYHVVMATKNEPDAPENEKEANF
jgi:hypothetical protein